MLVNDRDGSFGIGVTVVTRVVAWVSSTDGNRGGQDRLAFGSADGEGESGGAVAVAIGGAAGAVTDVAGVGDDAVDGMEVLADLGGFGNEDAAALEGGAEFDEDFFLERCGEGAEFDFVVA